MNDVATIFSGAFLAAVAFSVASVTWHRSVWPWVRRTWRQTRRASRARALRHQCAREGHNWFPSGDAMERHMYLTRKGGGDRIRVECLRCGRSEIVLCHVELEGDRERFEGVPQ